MQSRSIQRKGLTAWSTRDLLVAVVISVVIGLLLIPILLYTHALMMVLSPAVEALLTGFWVVTGILIPYILRRPGAAFLGALLVGVVEGPFSPFGWILLLIQAVVGIMCEIPFFVTRYRTYHPAFLLFAGGFGNLGPLVINYTLYSYAHLAPGVQITSIIAHFVGGVLGALLAILIAKALLPTGVLNGFAIGHERNVEI